MARGVALGPRNAGVVGCAGVRGRAEYPFAGRDSRGNAAAARKRASGRSSARRGDRRSTAPPRDARSARRGSPVNGGARIDVLSLAARALGLDRSTIRVGERTLDLQGQRHDPRATALAVEWKSVGVSQRRLGRAGYRPGRLPADAGARGARRDQQRGLSTRSDRGSAPSASDDDDRLRLDRFLRAAANLLSRLASLVSLPLVSSTSPFREDPRVRPSALPMGRDTPATAAAAPASAKRSPTEPAEHETDAAEYTARSAADHTAFPADHAP